MVKLEMLICWVRFSVFVLVSVFRYLVIGMVFLGEG